MFADVQDSCLFCNISKKSFVCKFYQKLKPSHSYPNVHLKFLHKFCTCLFQLENAPRHVAWFGVKNQFHIFFDYRCFQWVRLLWKFSMKVRLLLERYIIYMPLFHLPFRFCKQISKLYKNRLNGKAWTSRTSISWFKYITSFQKLLQDWRKKNPNKIWYRIDRSDRMWIFLT